MKVAEQARPPCAQSGAKDFWKQVLPLRALLFIFFVILMPLLCFSDALERQMYVLLVANIIPLVSQHIIFAWQVVLYVPALLLFWPSYVAVFPRWASTQMWHEGALPSQIPVIHFHPHLASVFDSKLAWREVLMAHNVPMPKLYGTLVHGGDVAEDRPSASPHEQQGARESKGTHASGTSIGSISPSSNSTKSDSGRGTSVRGFASGLAFVGTEEPLGGELVVIKPDRGTFGAGVQVSTIAEFTDRWKPSVRSRMSRFFNLRNFLPHLRGSHRTVHKEVPLSSYLVEQRLHDVDADYARTYRLATMIDTTAEMKGSDRYWSSFESATRVTCAVEVALLEVANAKTLTVSNLGGVSVVEDRSLFPELRKQLLRVHASEFPDFPAIGWDILNSREVGPVVLEGNIGSGICWKNHTHCLDILASADKLYRAFYRAKVGPTVAGSASSTFTPGVLCSVFGANMAVLLCMWILLQAALWVARVVRQALSSRWCLLTNARTKKRKTSNMKEEQLHRAISLVQT